MIPEPGQVNLNFSNFIILLGVVQGILLSVTGFVSRRRAGRIKGFLFLIITCIMTEFFLNRTGYMYRIIALVDFSEPFQFAIPPLIYLGVLSIGIKKDLQRWQLHFLPLILYMLYFLPFYLAPGHYKLESYYFIHHLNDIRPPSEYHFYSVWGYFRRFQMQVFYLQTTVYLIFTFQELRHTMNTSDGRRSEYSDEIRWWTIFSILFSLFILVVIAVKIIFVRDLGDHIIAIFLTIILYLGTVAELLRHSHETTQTVVNSEKVTRIEVAASGIDDSRKNEIHTRLVTLMKSQHLYRDNLISLQKLGKHTGEPAYIVSKVINEKTGFTFFDWIAYLRVEEAKKLLTDPKAGSYTIEQIAEDVGYNSKSAFNKAFRKFTGQTPSEFKNS